MSANKSIIEALFEGLDKGVLNEDTKAKLTSIINETVDARVEAKEKLIKEEFEQKHKTLLEEVEATKAKILKEAEENEKVFLEQAEKFKKELEDTVVEETLKFKELKEAEVKAKIEEKDKEVAELIKGLQQVTLEETKEYKLKQDTALVEDVKNFKAGLIDKVSDYLETKLSESIPAEIMESAAKVAVFEPLVTSIMEGFSKNYVKLDTTSYDVLKEAKAENAALESKLQEAAKLEVKLKKEIRDVNRQMKIKSLTEGLTQSQKDKAIKLLEGVELEELENRYGKIRDIIIESTIRPTQTKPVVQKTEKLDESVKTPASTPIADSAIVQHQVKKILNESDVKTGNTASAPKKQDTPMSTWASRIKPGYIETPKK